MENEIEVWKDVPNYEGLYQVSSIGRVKSFITWRGINERILKAAIHSTGYLIVSLKKYSKQKMLKVHKLVAMAFHGHIPDGTNKIVVDHINNNKLDNRVANLRLTTNRDNCSKDQKSKGRSSQYTGVYLDKKTKKWQAEINFKGIKVYLGLFELEIHAHYAYKKVLLEIEQGLDLNILYPKWRHKTSQYKGVSWDKNRNKWVAKYKEKNLGRFNTEIEAFERIQNYIESLNLLV